MEWDEPDIQQYCRICDSCQRMKPAQGKRAGLLQPIVPDGVPASHWGVDFIGPLPKGTGGMRYILIAVDYTTRLVVVQAARMADGKALQKFLHEWVIQRNGWMKRLTTDQGTPFRSRLSQAFFDEFHIEHRMTTSYHQQADGLAESSQQDGDDHGSPTYGALGKAEGLGQSVATARDGLQHERSGVYRI